jgi:hypothetical protein
MGHSATRALRVALEPNLRPVVCDAPCAALIFANERSPQVAHITVLHTGTLVQQECLQAQTAERISSKVRRCARNPKSRGASLRAQTCRPVCHRCRDAGESNTRSRVRPLEHTIESARDSYVAPAFPMRAKVLVCIPSCTRSTSANAMVQSAGFFFLDTQPIDVPSGLTLKKRVWRAPERPHFATSSPRCKAVMAPWTSQAGRRKSCRAHSE